MDELDIVTAELAERTQLHPDFEFSLDDTIFYMGGGKVCSAPIMSRMLVQNLHDDWNSNPEQKTAFVPFGPSGTYYNTCHGMLCGNQVFATKKQLLETL